MTYPLRSVLVSRHIVCVAQDHFDLDDGRARWKDVRSLKFYSTFLTRVVRGKNVGARCCVVVLESGGFDSCVMKPLQDDRRLQDCPKRLFRMVFRVQQIV